jgi:serine protease
VHAYIVDTGVLLTHNEFSGRMGNGFDAVTSGGNANDCHGHGTHVAGTVGGTTYGVAKGVTIHPVRVLGCTGSGTNAGVIAGMDWVAQNRVLPAVANMSLGGGASQATDDAVARMTAAGVTVVVAAGNDNASDACTKSPARAPSAITVGSTTSTDARSSFSNVGTCLDIFAPGSSITSAWFTSPTATNTISGTSMASPHVAGGAALYLATNPTATPAQVTQALTSSATPGIVTDARTGSPNLLLYTLGGAAPVDTTPPSTVSGLSATASGSAQINLSWSAATDTGGSGLAGYRIERCTGAGCTSFAQIATSTTASYANTGLAASTSYSYRVRAYDGAGNNGGYSATAPATTTAGGGGGTELTKGVPVTGLTATTGNSLNYTMVVPAGSTNLTFTTSGGTGDADMYVKFGSAPTDTVYDCRPYTGGNAETCTFAAPSAGTYHVRVKAYSTFSGVSLVGNYTTGGGGGTQTYTNTTDYTISDNTTTNSPIAVSGRTGNGQASTPVAVNIVHTYIGDLVVSLVAPDGSVYTLHNRTGGSADNINTTYNVNLSSEVLNGTWNLRVADQAGGDVGYINSWSVTF